MKRTIQKKPLKLYVWHDVLTDWTHGVMVALAPDAETARRMLMDGEPAGGQVDRDLFASPVVWEAPNCLKVWGGG